MSMVIDSLPPENRGAGFSFQSVITTLVLLPAPLIAQYLVVTFNFDLGMRIAYILVAVAYFAIAILRLKLKETLPATEKSQRPSLSAHYGTILNQLKKAFMFGRRFPNQPLTFS
jgi:MFS family permease